mgnify:CR=1 FL=1
MKTRTCESCKHYKAYYRKCNFGFCAEWKNLCELRGEYVFLNSLCENFEKLPTPPTTLQTLDQAEEDIKYLLKIFKED